MSSSNNNNAGTIIHTNGGNANDDDDDEGEPILEPEKVHRNADDTDEILHEVKCKLFSFSKEDNEWKDIGLGSFRITKDAKDHRKRMLVRNQIGKISLNASFYPKMKIEKVKKGLRFSVVVSVDGKGAEMRNYMLQLSIGDVSATLAKMEQCIAEVAAN